MGVGASGTGPEPTSRPCLGTPGQRKTLYIASDEGNRGFFEAFRAQGYRVFMWSDVKPFLGNVEGREGGGGIRPEEVGLVEQVSNHPNPNPNWKK